MLKVVIVSNELPPYRIPLFEGLGRVSDIAFQVIFCTRREPNRQWELPALEFDHVFLSEQVVEHEGRYIHNNLEVFSALARFSPDVVITCGFNPTHLYAFAYAVARGLPHIAMTDGTLDSEAGLSRLHRLARRIVYARTRAFICASEGGRRLYESYGVPATRCFKSCLCIDNAAFAAPAEPVAKSVDFLFCGRIESIKNPHFALNVAIETARRLGRQTSILFIGAGQDESSLRESIARHSDLVRADFEGFRPHADLPGLYHAARLFLLPTRWDPWGVVVNEACAAGLPVIVSPYAGAAGELVQDGANGFVRPLDLAAWADAAVMLLSRDALYAEFSRRSVALVSQYNYASAVAGIDLACRSSARDKPRAAASPLA